MTRKLNQMNTLPLVSYHKSLGFDFYHHCRWTLYQKSHEGGPRILEWVAYPFFSGSSRPRNWIGVSCITGGFFTNWAIREAHFTTRYRPERDKNIWSLKSMNVHSSFIHNSQKFVYFWYHGNAGPVEWVWKCSFLCTFWNSLRG